MKKRIVTVLKCTLFYSWYVPGMMLISKTARDSHPSLRFRIKLAAWGFRASAITAMNAAFGLNISFS